MKREDIKKAAINYEEELIYNPKDMYDDEKSFIAGAEWRINSVWHDVSEVPEEGKNALAKTEYGVYLLGPCMNEGKYREFCEELGLTCWAYIEDLTPNTEE